VSQFHDNINDHSDKLKHVLWWLAAGAGWVLSKVTEFEQELRAFCLLCTVIIVIFQAVHWVRKTFNKKKRDELDD
jgi:hypothetical protein